MTGSVCLVLCVFATAVTALFCLRAFPRHAGLRRLSALLVPLGQLVFTASVLRAATLYEMAITYFAGVCVAHVFGCIGTYCLMQGVRKTRSAAVNAERLRLAQEGAQATEEYTDLLATNADKMRGLCGDLAAELDELRAGIDGSSDCGEEGASRDAVCGGHEALDFAPVEAALDGFERQTRSSYCANRIVSAILVLKARACECAGVEFAFEGGVPEELAIDELELCSVFSNLLDNAMNAAINAKDSENRDGRRPYTCASCTMRGAYLVVKVSNSCAGEGEGRGGGVAGSPGGIRVRHKVAGPMRAHGWGLEIVSDICAQHEGSFALERSAAGEATAIAILKVAGA